MTSLLERSVLLAGLLPGPREWLLIGMVVLACFWRTGVPRGRVWRLLQPWSSVPKRQPRPTWVHRLSDRGFLLLLVMAASAVIAWIISWTLIAQTVSKAG